MKFIAVCCVFSFVNLFTHAQQATPRATTGPHQATLHYQNNTCTTATLCQIQVWRARCMSPTSCPGWGGLNVWTQLSSGTASATPTDTGTTWTVLDQDPALQDSTTYEYLATNSFQSSPTNYSPRSATWVGTTNAGGSGIPVSPTVGAGNSIN